MNNANLIGRLTRDVELRYTQAGKAVASFTLAINRGFGKDNEADFIQCVTWEKTAENMAQYTGKGSQVGITGRIQTRRYENKDGQTVNVTEVVANMVEFIGTKSDHEAKPRQENQAFNPDYVDSDDFEAVDEDDFENESLPF